MTNPHAPEPVGREWPHPRPATYAEQHDLLRRLGVPVDPAEDRARGHPDWRAEAAEALADAARARRRREREPEPEPT